MSLGAAGNGIFFFLLADRQLCCLLPVLYICFWRVKAVLWHSGQMEKMRKLLWTCMLVWDSDGRQRLVVRRQFSARRHQMILKMSAAEFLDFNIVFGTWCDSQTQPVAWTISASVSALVSERRRTEERTEENHKATLWSCHENRLKTDMLSMTLLLTIHFSSSADQAFCPLCRQHLTDVNREEVMTGLRETGLCCCWSSESVTLWVRDLCSWWSSLPDAKTHQHRSYYIIIIHIIIFTQSLVLRLEDMWRRKRGGEKRRD